MLLSTSYLLRGALLYSLSTPFVSSQVINPNIPIRFPFPWRLFCGIAQGWQCCTPNFEYNAVYGPLVSCSNGMGCDLDTSTCVAPCGSPGQPCCDGPETRALKWKDDGRIFSPAGWNMKEMCNEGFCETARHRCVGCVSADGAPCCPPDASQATARCNGENLECKFDDISATSGTCFLCGGINRPPCRGECESGLKLRSGVCVACGDVNQVACDVVEYMCNQGCKTNLLLVNGMCLPCGDVGQVPCGVPAAACIDTVYWYRCKPGLGMRQGVCQICGTEGKSPCDNGCVAGHRIKHGLCTTRCGREGQEPCDGGFCIDSLQVLGGICKACGTQNKPPCPSGGCRSGLKLRQRVCTRCGADNQPPCDSGCDRGLLTSNGICSDTCGLEDYPPCDSGCQDGRTVNSVGYCVGPPACAGEGAACVTGDFGTAGTGLTCCTSGEPLICTFARCRRCIQHGQPVPLGGTQICCERDDFVVIDDDGGQKCDIPDAG